jgi:hypothetical protein
MARTERVIVVFVASPSDLDAERNCLEEVIRELNISWSGTFGLRLDLVRWETQGYPDVGADAQEVLNRELPNDYDIFIGLMWGRFGTPTSRAGSGTEEEFNRALTRRKAGEAVKLMFYFKDAPLAPSLIDVAQLASVQRFKSGLGAEGGLYWLFNTPEDFENLARLHLARQIQEFVGANRPPVPVEPAGQGAVTIAVLDEEPGLIDVLDASDEHFNALNEIVARISTEMQLLTSQTQLRTSEVETAMAEANGPVSRRLARTLVERSAADMNHFVARVRAELPLFKDHLEKGADAIARAALISATFPGEGRAQVLAARENLATWRDATQGAHDATGQFRDSVQRLPRMTAVLNHARRETVAVLEEVIESLSSGIRVSSEAVSTLDVFLRGSGPELN